MEKEREVQTKNSELRRQTTKLQRQLDEANKKVRHLEKEKHDGSVSIIIFIILLVL